MTEGKDIFQTLFEGAVNHYSRVAIVEALDFIAGLSEDDLKEWTSGMGPTEVARVYRVWRAARMDEKTVLLSNSVDTIQVVLELLKLMTEDLDTHFHPGIPLAIEHQNRIAQMHLLLQKLKGINLFW